MRPGNRIDADGDTESAATVKRDDTKSSGVLRLPPSQLDFVVEKAQGNRVLTAECVLSLDKCPSSVGTDEKLPGNIKRSKPTAIFEIWWGHINVC